MLLFLRKKLHSLYQSFYQIIFGRSECVADAPLAFSNVPDFFVDRDLNKRLKEISNSNKKMNDQFLEDMRVLERASLIRSINSCSSIPTSRPFNCIIGFYKNDSEFSFRINKALGFEAEQPGDHGFLMR